MFTPQTDGRAHPRGWPMALAIAGRAETVREGFDRAATHVIALMSPAARAPGIEPAGEGAALRLRFDDVANAAHSNAARPEMLDAVCAVVDALPAAARLLIHCRQGLGRSPAVALGLLARAMTPEEAGARLHAIRPHAALKRVGWRFSCETWRPRAPRAVPMEARP